mgnify:CR=1 FL=1
MKLKTWTFLLLIISLMVVLFACQDEEKPMDSIEQTVYFTVSFDMAGGSAMDPVIVLENETLNDLLEPSKEGYDFVGWFLDDDLFDLTTPITNDLTLTAKWVLSSPSNVNRDASYKKNVNAFSSLHPYRLIHGQTDAYDVLTLISDTLYTLDYDWELAIELGIAHHINDFSQTEALPVGYVPSMALRDPIDVNDDGLIWEIEIKEGLMFSDGTPINTETFSYAYQTFLELDYQAYQIPYEPFFLLKLENGYAFNQSKVLEKYQHITFEDVGFEIISETTMRFHLIYPMQMIEVKEALSKMDTTIIHEPLFEASKDHVDDTLSYLSMDQPHVSFGPYEIDTWDENHIILKKNDAYHDQTRYLIETLEYTFGQNATQRLSAFNQGDLDIIPASGIFSEQVLVPYQDISLDTSTQFSLFFITHYDEHEEIQNPIVLSTEFRKALYFATHQTHIAQNIRVLAAPAFSLLGDLYYSSSRSPFSIRQSMLGQMTINDFLEGSNPFDGSKAKTLFDQAYQDLILEGHIHQGDKITVTFSFTENNYNMMLGQYLKQSWETAFGLDFFELILDPKAASDHSPLGDIIINGYQAAVFDPIVFLQVYLSPSAYQYDDALKTDHLMIEASLPGLKEELERLFAYYDEKESLSLNEQGRLENIQLVLEYFEESLFKASFQDVIYALLNELYMVSYPLRDAELETLTHVIERALLQNVVAIPLYTINTPYIVSEYVTFLQQSVHPRIQIDD